MDHRTLIERLGGPHKLNAKLRERGVLVSNVAARAWSLGGERKIPAKYWLHVVAIAQAADVPVTVADLAADVAAKPKAAKRRRAAA